jgi:ribonuclease VapC
VLSGARTWIRKDDRAFRESRRVFQTSFNVRDQLGGSLLPSGEAIWGSKDLTREAARIKVTKRMAYADCFAAALARLKKGELYTGDPEFKAVEKDIKVVWL